MPTLQEYNLPPFAGEVAEADLQEALRTAVDLNGRKLFITVDRGFDAEIADVIMATPSQELMPLVRLNVWTEEEVIAMTSTPVFARYNCSLYLFFYYGVPATDPAYDSFVTMRRRFIQSTLQALQLEMPGLSTGINPMQTKWWKRDSERPVMVDYQSPFRYLTKSYEPANGYNCVRIDYPLLINSGAVV